MQQLKSCSKDEFQQALDLINATFREGKQMMEKEFPLLLSEENSERRVLMKVDDEVAAIVNYYKSNIHIEGTSVNVGSIGAVCTANNHRGKGFATKILNEIDQRMLNENIHVQLISGDRALYTRRGASFGGKVLRVKLTENKSNHLYTYEEVEEKDVISLLKIYNCDSTRFYRNHDEMVALMYAGKAAYEHFKKVYLNNMLIGYFVISENFKRVVEFGGSLPLIIQSIQQYQLDNKLGDLNLDLLSDSKDISVIYEKNYEVEERNHNGTIKIIDINGLLNALRPYAIQYIPEDVFDLIKVEKKVDSYVFYYKDEAISLGGDSELVKLIFGSWDDTAKKDTELNGILQEIFPIPFPMTDNLNFI
ncbi:GNAT family N-acetyltransferase [Vallitalea okinawensis]|uniref:GNAT family N-acetyltransferase n=1 Tax=Vallitalea okinawensis TaxID=2078660 RepID=UPI000CFAFF7B|nr:GNAT family N-acetyltransferase [Vallitalea okinawensis]